MCPSRAMQTIRIFLSELQENAGSLWTLECSLKEKKDFPSHHGIKATEPGEDLINPHLPTEGNSTAQQAAFQAIQESYQQPQ